MKILQVVLAKVKEIKAKEEEERTVSEKTGQPTSKSPQPQKH